MADGVKQRVLRAFTASGSSAIANLVIQVLQVPLFLHFWGKIQYGEWLVLSGIPAFLAMADLSFANTAGNTMTALVAQEKIEEARKVYRCTLAVVGLVSAGVMLIFNGLAWLVPWYGWVRFEEISFMDAHWILLLLTLQVAGGQLIGVWHGVLRSVGAHHLTLHQMNVLRIGGFLVTALVMLFTKSALVVAIATTVAMVLTTAVSAWHAKIHAPWSWPIRPSFDKQIGLEILKPAAVYSLLPLGFALNVQGFVIVLGVVASKELLVAFNTARTLTRFIPTFCEAVNTSIIFEVGAAAAKGHFETAQKLVRRGSQLTFWLAVGLALFLATLGPFIYAIWTKREVSLDYGSFLILLVGTVVNAIWMTASVVPKVTNQHYRFAYWFLGGSALALVLTYILVPMFGLMAAAASLLAVEILILVAILPHSLAMIQDRPGNLFRAIFDFKPIIARLRRKPAETGNS